MSETRIIEITIYAERKKQCKIKRKLDCCIKKQYKIKVDKTMNELLDILKEAMPKVDWENGEDLVDDGVIDSMDVVTIISEITDAYDIEIPSEEMEPENFNSAKAIYEMIQRLEEE